ncbi:hypothetical protein GY45DRAFT_1327313 [Cubamyces sp. BRFM 1775]|nr:hypothetical protein GY45DRAFT_1327313 [Cubamyces sp. BRFM 1775]
MKAFTAAILTLFAFAAGVNAAAVEPGTDLTAVSPFPVIDTALTNPDGTNLTTLEVSPCFWSGTAPFCAGSCPAGYVDCGRDGCGDGACCWTGIKVYCCRENSGQC